MNESQRIAYLKAMGVDQYYPRRVLSHAKASPCYQFDQPPRESEPPAKVPTPEPVILKEETTTEPKRKPRPVPRAVKDKPAQPAPVRSRSAADAKRASGFSFNLEYYRVHSDLAVIADRPPQITGDQQQQAMELLSAILAAVLPTEQDKLPRADRFSWPLATDLAVDSSTEQAAKALQGFIRSKQEQDGFSNLLLFTEVLAGLLAGKDPGEPDLPVQFTGSELRLTPCHGLHSMLAVPALKRDTWQALQALRGRLQGSD